MQRYMAIAACLLLVFVFGWLYWPTDKKATPIATNQPSGSSQKPNLKTTQSGQSAPTPADETPSSQNRQETVAQISVRSKSVVTNRVKGNSGLIDQHISHTDSPVSGSEWAVVPAKSNEAKPELVKPDAAQPVNPKTEQLAENTPSAKPVPVVERGLVVTITEPEALVAARQAVKTDDVEKPVVAVNDKPEKEVKGTTFWQQVKRIKQSDVFAQGNNSDTESSLVGRAYNGLKHNFDKDKSAKQ